MKYRKLGFLLVLMPGLAVAQQPDAQGPLRDSLREQPGSVDVAPSRSPEGDLEGATLPASRSAARDLDGTNATTLAVLRANCPKSMPEADWLRLMEKPENATLYPLRITQAMLDTLDARELDLRYRYVLVK